jgi:anaerobic magnesium-protoporphyrin IX monomethyl ester cyclase
MPISGVIRGNNEEAQEIAFQDTAKRTLRVLLIQPPTTGAVTSLFHQVDEGTEGIGYKPPLGLLYIATTLKNYTNHEVKVLDAIAQKVKVEDIIREVSDFQPDVVGISAWTDFWYPAYNLGKQIKQVLPQTHLNYGGPHLGIYPKETLEIPFVDSVIVGDGEIPFIRLCNLIANEEIDDAFPGLHFKENGLREGPDTYYIQKNLDDLPIPDRTLLPINLYSSVIGKNKYITTMITSRGCPYKCTFCKLNFQKTLCQSAERVVAEFKEISDLGIREVEIYDDTFTWSKDRLKDICNGLIKANLPIQWAVRDRVSSADTKLYELMYRAGCRRIHLGIESGVQHVLDRMRKQIKVEQAQKAVTLAKKAGMTVLTYFMFGNLDETLHDMRKTIEFALELDADYATFSVTIPYAGTEMYLEALSSGLIPNDYWREYALSPVPNFTPSKLIENHVNMDQMIKLSNDGIRQFYFRRKYIIRQVKSLGNVAEFFRKARMGLQLLTGVLRSQSIYTR